MMEQNFVKYYQVSTLQALALGFSKSVITVGELLQHGNLGLGTFEDVDGEMIVLDGKCYRAKNNGEVVPAENERGVPFASICCFQSHRTETFEKMDTIEQIKEWLTLRIEEEFGLNSMYAVRINGEFSRVDARSESGTKAHHVTLKDALSITQKAFIFENIKGSLVCVYYPDYMDGINAAGWHMHFLSEDKRKGGHVFDISMTRGNASFCKITSLEIRIPDSPAFDTYALKCASKEEIQSVEQGKS
ncbi:putative alpha-acetolactate decarboxylase (plasmid) [Selenomonas ruminantium subsp. lactilytica TAM6421]|uniref:Alpha-acetolactate decarboxylase n=1 Tax=Selenomonas ruminantium subsp. lactilytica (strain NBRC 103574 / TAM6421) TaxID=927704 RepID=I0GVR2_SELRL|nr:acetolactate decarboxylase [Selenomonas ruminantium]BAL84849.1 putative alpha-acetolactate decarboxylase [Selenomonas ruminantium subsp. lactilytica TAM6421]